MKFDLSTSETIMVLMLVIWEFVWKGIALWKAGRNNQSGWFIAMLILNTAGILPILYLLIHRKEAGHEKTLPIN